MIHSAKLGSVERFIPAFSPKRHAGAFPAWLSPSRFASSRRRAFDGFVKIFAG